MNVVSANALTYARPSGAGTSVRAQVRLSSPSASSPSLSRPNLSSPSVQSNVDPASINSQPSVSLTTQTFAPEPGVSKVSPSSVIVRLSSQRAGPSAPVLSSLNSATLTQQSAEGFGVRPLDTASRAPVAPTADAGSVITTPEGVVPSGAGDSLIAPSSGGRSQSTLDGGAQRESVQPPEPANGDRDAPLEEEGGLGRSNTQSEQAAAQAQAEKAQAEAERAEIQALKARDLEVRRHEQAHAAAGGPYAGAPSYEFTTGPDGARYATGGEVSIDTSPVPGDPQATLEKAQTVRRAALAPAEPSEQDRRVAAEASQMAAQARIELLQLQRADAAEGDEDQAPSEPLSGEAPTTTKEEDQGAPTLLNSSDDEDDYARDGEAQETGPSARERYAQVYGNVSSSLVQQVSDIAQWTAAQPIFANLLDDIV